MLSERVVNGEAMLRVPLYNREGETVGEVALAAEVFEVEADPSLVHQALVRQLANARQGTADTRTRGEVRGGGAKPYRQKGTGRARQGSRRAPHFRGGGVAFGPHPRSYAQRLPKKARRLVLRALLSEKAQGGRLVVLDELSMGRPSTRELVGVLNRLPLEKPLLIATEGDCANLVLSARNIDGVSTEPATSLNVAGLMSSEYLLLEKSGLERVEAWLGAGGGTSDVQL